MSDLFLHGIQNATIDDGARPITTVRSSTIGLIGTAPEADPLIFPLNKPVLIAGSRTLAAKLGETGTLPQALDSIFDQIGAVVIVVRIDEEKQLQLH
jgi:phage tail sheath protein FI